MGQYKKLNEYDNLRIDGSKSYDYSKICFEPYPQCAKLEEWSNFKKSIISEDCANFDRTPIENRIDPPVDFVKKYENTFNKNMWNIISRSNMDNEFIAMYFDKLDLKIMLMRHLLDEKFIDFIINKITVDNIECLFINIDYKDSILEYHPSNYYSLNYILEQISQKTWNYIFRDIKFNPSVEFILKYADKINIYSWRAILGRNYLTLKQREQLKEFNDSILNPVRTLTCSTSDNIENKE